MCYWFWSTNIITQNWRSLFYVSYKNFTLACPRGAGRGGTATAAQQPEFPGAEKTAEQPEPSGAENISGKYELPVSEMAGRTPGNAEKTVPEDAAETED